MESTIKTYLQGSDFAEIRDLREKKNVVYHRISHEESFTFKFQVSEEPELTFHSKREELYLRAISNLLKKTDFLKLYIEVVSGQITDEEYEAELTNNSENYFVEINPITSSFEYFSLIDILRKFPKRHLSVDDFSDLFGISHGEICNALK